MWVNAVATLLYKKKCKADLNNYRPISLLSQNYKLFCKFAYHLTRKLDFYQPRKQTEFRVQYNRHYSDLEDTHKEKHGVPSPDVACFCSL